MATNPQFPQQRGPQRVPDAPRLKVPPRKQFPWPIVAIIAAAAILAAIIALMPTTPHKRTAPPAAEVPGQPTGSQVQLSHLKLQPGPTGGAVYLAGQLTNTGNTDITGVQVQATFKGANGQTVQTQMRPVEELKGPAQVQNFTNDPIKPNQARDFRITFDNVPAGWNHEMPALSINAVTGTKP
jgi:Protein of unknown function (DUF2393)/Protein of unknown function (DUF3426)